MNYNYLRPIRRTVLKRIGKRYKNEKYDRLFDALGGRDIRNLLNNN